MTKKLLPALLVTGILAAGPAHAQGKQVGWVETVSADAAGATVTRNGKTETVSALMPVQPGDEFRVTQGKVMLVVAGADPVTVDPAHSPFVVKAKGDTPDLWSRVFGYATKQMTGSAVKPTGTTAAVARDLPESHILRSPLLETKETYFSAGAPAFDLSWQGGQPPYEVKVTPDRGGTPLQAGGLTDRRLHAAGWHLPPGTFTVTITDRAGQKVQYGMDAVEPAKLPTAPSELTQAALPGPAQDMVYALWLAQQADGAWKLEAYRRLLALGDALPTARKFAARLEADEAKEGGP